jgi:hypothetical protein
MTTSVSYHCSLSPSECLRLLREVGSQPEQWKSVAPDFAGNTKVKNNGRFLLAPSRNGVVGIVSAENSHSIVRARLSPPLWAVLIFIFGPLIVMIQVMPPLIVIGYALWVSLLALVLLRTAAKAFQQLKAILPPATPQGFPLVGQQEHGHRSTAAHATQTSN